MFTGSSFWVLLLSARLGVDVHLRLLRLAIQGEDDEGRVH